VTRTVAVVDYGMGNLRSVSQAVAHVARDQDVRVIVTGNPEEVAAAERIVLPGQGAMRDCMHELRASGLRDAVLDALRVKPVMGVCVGMQMLLDHSEEQDTPGLGVIAGRVRRFRLEGGRQPDGSRCTSAMHRPKRSSGAKPQYSALSRRWRRGLRHQTPLHRPIRLVRLDNAVDPLRHERSYGE
jgi:hypothetical protein